MATPVRKVAKPSAPPPALAPAPTSQAPVQQAAPAPETKPAPQVDPTAAVPKKAEEKPKEKPAEEKTCEVRPIHGFPIFIARQNILAKGGVWTLVRHTNWIDTQVKARILEVK